MAKEYIERDAAIKHLEIHKKKAKENNFVLCANEDSIIKFLREKCPTADVVEVETVKAWLYEMAINNVGCVIDGDFSNACEEIIARLDGLRNFAKERSEG